MRSHMQIEVQILEYSMSIQQKILSPQHEKRILCALEANSCAR